MESSRGQGGIQQLLAAEQEAQHIVNTSRSGNYSICCVQQIYRLNHLKPFIWIYPYRLISMLVRVYTRKNW